MRISFDPPKRAWTLTHRGLDFEDAASVFEGLTAEVEDERKDYGELGSFVLEFFRTAWWSSGTRRAATYAMFSA